MRVVVVCAVVGVWLTAVRCCDDGVVVIVMAGVHDCERSATRRAIP